MPSQCLTICTIAYRSNPESYNWQLVLTPSMGLSAYGRAMFNVVQAQHSWLVALEHRDVNENSLACNHREAIARLPHWPSLLWNLLSRLNCTYIMALQAIAVCTGKLHVHTVIACRPRCPWFRMRSTESLVLVTWYLIIVNVLKVSFDNFLKRSDNVEDY